MLGEQELDGPAQGGAVERVDNVKPAQGGKAEDEAVCGLCNKCKLLLELAACRCGMLRLHAASQRDGVKTDLGTELKL